ncbi:MAG TPA: isoprenyl transferase [Bauldia sp.]|nr:isoprenyl transferase [Bauldia sp.]
MTSIADERAIDAKAGNFGSRVPRHVAIIMDGNGRWAAARGLPRSEGHRRGVEAVRRTVRASLDLGIGYLTLFSFSSENWSRPPAEVDFIFGLLRFFIRRDLAALHRDGVRVRVIGARERLPADIAELIDEAEKLTADNRALTFVVAFNYGSRDEIARAARRIARAVKAGTLDPEKIDTATVADHLDTSGIPDPDLVIRTSGEMRLSNFLLWQAAYAELVFLPVYWPDFTEESLRAAIEQFTGRSRRYGGVGARTGA